MEAKEPNIYEIVPDRMRQLVGEFPCYREFSVAVGVTRPAVENWCNGRVLPRLEVVAEICRRRDVSLDWLVGRAASPGRELVQCERWHW